jgi:hypothetical protein
MAGGNIIAPPVDAKLIASLVNYAWDNPALKKAKKIYGSNVSKKSVDAVEKVLKKGGIFRPDDVRLGL